MSAPDLKDAVHLVETLGLAPLARSYAAMPKTYYGSSSAYSKWQLRHREIEDQVKSRLEEHGARVKLGGGQVAIAFAGYRATSTMGMKPALQNWRARVERELVRRDLHSRKKVVR